MPLGGSASIRVPAIAATNGPSVSKASDVSVIFNGLTDISSFSIVIGRAATSPATKVALSDQILYDALSVNSLSFHETGGGAAYAGSLQAPYGIAGGTAGQLYWVCLFQLPIASLVDSSVPDLVLGPFTKVA